MSMPRDGAPGAAALLGGTGYRIARYGDVTVLTPAGQQEGRQEGQQEGQQPGHPQAALRLAVACDSLGAIGPKAHDVLHVPGYVVGRFACRVPLMELIAVGAEPLLVVCALCVEPEPAGTEIMAGVRDEVRAAGLDPAAAITGSTEKNMPTTQTGVGVTALGVLLTPAALRWGRGRPGDVVVAVGRPKVGAAVRLDDAELADIPTLKLALAHPACGDAVPVGSRGIAAEAADLARRSNCSFVAAADAPIDLAVSAGPATCFLVTVADAGLPALDDLLVAAGRPWAAVGRLEASGSGSGLGAAPCRAEAGGCRQ